MADTATGGFLQTSYSFRTAARCHPIKYVSLHMCIHIYTDMYHVRFMNYKSNTCHICIYASMYVCVYMYTYIYTHIHMCIYIYTHMSIHVCVYIRIYIHIYIYISRERERSLCHACMLIPFIPSLKMTETARAGSTRPEEEDEEEQLR